MDQTKQVVGGHAAEKGQASGRHALWLAVLAPAVALLIGIIAFSAYASTPLSIAGYADFAYGAGVTNEPTANAAESKVWWNDGYWWGILYNAQAGEYRIYRMDGAAQEWVDTGVAADEREDSRSDVLWDEATQRLYVASHSKIENPSPPNSNPDNWTRLYRYSYDTGTNSYSLDTDFPAPEVSRYRTESLVIDKDSTGRLWATWVGRVMIDTYEVYVSYSEGNDLEWSSAYRLPFTIEAEVDRDDISALVAFSDDEGAKIGVLWSNQLDGRFHFATHLDSADPQSGWTLDANFAAAVTAPADDHMDFATTTSGELFMVVKTGIDPVTQPDETLLALITRESDGTTSFIEITPGSSRDTRPIVLVDESASELNVFTVNRTGGEAVCRFPATITSPLSNIIFLQDNCAPPDGEPADSPAALANLVDAQVFIGDADTYLLTNNPTSTKQRIDDTTGVLVLASDEHTDYYVHNLVGYTPPEPEETATPTGTIEPTATGTQEATPTATGTAGPTPTSTVGPTPTGTIEATATIPAPAGDEYQYLPFFSNASSN